MPEPEDNSSNNDSQELVLTDVVEVSPEELSDDQKTFLQDNAEDLSDEQKETYKDALEKEGDGEPEDVEPATRTKPEAKPEDEEDEDVDPDDEKTINKVVAEQLRKAGVGDTRDQLEIDSHIRENPELSKHRTNALRYMKAHPTLTARDAMRIVSSDDQQKIGAEKEREAAKKASDTRGGGDTIRKPAGAGIDWGKATKEEVAAKKAEILGHDV